MSVIVKVTRRDFLRRTGVGAGAFVLGCYINPGGVLEARNLVREARNILKHGLPLNAFVSMHLDGVVEFLVPRSEMGQGIRYSLAAVLADELEADWSKMKVVQSDADGARFAIGNPNVNVDPDASPAYLINDEISQFADSSRSMALFYMPMRLFGAGIRLVMIKAAARKWGVDPTECYAKQHHVHQKGSSRSEPYQHLLLEAAMVGLPQMPEILAALKPQKDWTYIGTKNMPFNDAKDMVTGKAEYGADVELPGLLTAMVVRCPVANGGIKSFDDTETRKVPGVVNVVPIDLGNPLLRGGVGAGFMPHAGVAVVAKNTWAALQGRRALKVEWDLSGLAALNATYDSDAYRRELEQATASGSNAEVLRNKGDVYAALSAAGPDTVKADYYVPHLAQAPMEPPAATARYQNGRWEIWTPSQGPELTQHYVGLSMLYPADPVKWLVWQATELGNVRVSEVEDQKLFNKEYSTLQGWNEQQMFEMRDALKREIRQKVQVHVTLLGGGFGRKSKPDYAVEAAFLARVHEGTPVRVQWTREDDIQFSYYHAVSNQHMEAALDANGKPTAWLQRSAFPSFFATLFPGPFPGVPPIFLTARKAFHNGGKYGFGSGIEKAHGLEDMPYNLKNIRIENCPAQNHIRVGWMRSVSNIFHAFSACSFAHELAIKANAPDPKKYLLELIGEGGILDLEAEGVTAFDNNGFPAFREEGSPPIIARYPPDTRRLRGVIDKVAEISGWDQKYGKLGNRRGLGIAAHRSFLSYVAIVCDVSLSDKNELKINEIFGVIDCGLAVNVDRVLAQMEGGIVYGLSYALLGEITVKDGRVVQSNFDNYPVARLHQTPKITVDYIRSTAAPTGVGEPPTPAVAPALANAIVAAGGPRIREIPFYRKVVVN
jgi:isoquinoline 1-oxidoreductase beta subunit